MAKAKAIVMQGSVVGIYTASQSVIKMSVRPNRRKREASKTACTSSRRRQ